MMDQMERLRKGAHCQGGLGYRGSAPPSEGGSSESRGCWVEADYSAPLNLQVMGSGGSWLYVSQTRDRAELGTRI